MLSGYDTHKMLLKERVFMGQDTYVFLQTWEPKTRSGKDSHVNLLPPKPD